MACLIMYDCVIDMHLASANTGVSSFVGFVISFLTTTAEAAPFIFVQELTLQELINITVH